MPTVALHTLGCKLNSAETAAIGRRFLERGYTLVPVGEAADVCVINTCTVTARADRECRQIIRRALRAPKDPKLVVTGCYAQLRPEEVASIPGVDLVLGTREKFDVLSYLPELVENQGPRVHVAAAGAFDDFGPASTSAADDRTRAFLKVQDGCDYTCSFCTIPRARGASRSQSIEASVRQAEELVAQGYREIVLTGVNVGDYGRTSGTNLLSLLRALEPVRGLQRLRISSIEPNLLTDDIIEAAAISPVLCPHFHLPLQSGDDGVLRRMRRRYTSADYAARVEAIRRLLPDAGIGVDVIVGFPGETDAQFRRTAEFLSELPVSYLHVFTYSERPDTPAAGYADQVSPRERQRRNAVLRAIGEKKRLAFHAGMVGRTVPVLLESEVRDGRRMGLAPNYARVAVAGKGNMGISGARSGGGDAAISSEEMRENTIVHALITSATAACCEAHLVAEGVRFHHAERASGESGVSECEGVVTPGSLKGTTV
jgi:threonylcarbamoyladenosine tRNA methylthiotransferase MtaB